MMKQYGIPNSSLQNLKIDLSRGCRKTNQRRIMYVANTAIDTDEYYPMCCPSKLCQDVVVSL